MIELIENFKRPLCALLASLCLSVAVLAQTGKGTLSGQVTDPSGAAIPAATVTLTGPKHSTQATQTDEQGRYAFHNLAPGAYTVEISIQGFSPFEKSGLQVAPNHQQVVNAQLAVTMEKQQVTVESEGEQLSVSPENNVGSVVLKGEALKSLSDDPDELQSELEQLAGPAAGPNGGEIYIDGFSGGDLPPKEAILEVRVNQNPFSAQYERLGYGRIDITTKPGYQKYHGDVFSFGNDSAFNSRNPFVTSTPGYHSQMFAGSFGGPISKKASFFFHVFRRSTDSTSIINATVFNPAYTIGGTAPPGINYNAAIPSPSSRMNISPRGDFQLSNANVMSVRYQRWSAGNSNDGIGQLSLPSQAYDSSRVSHMVQVSDTQVISARTVTQLRFQYRHSTSNQTPFSTDPAVLVLSDVSSGGSREGSSLDTQDRSELQSLTSMNLGQHALTFGGRVRETQESVNSNGGYNGAFTFSGILPYAITMAGLSQGLTPAQILAAGGGANQFSITAGNPAARASRFDYALYSEDTWRMRSNVSLTMGLRLEGQNHISDHFDVAPRMGFAWGIGGGGKAPKTVLRAGAGIFYDRFDEDNILQAFRLNGITQQQYVVNSPDFFPGSIPPVNTLAGSATFPTIYQIAPGFQSPYVIQGAMGLERQVNRNIKASVTYITSHGVHQLLTRNINAPLPGTFDPSNPSSGIRPYGDVGNIYQYEPAGLYNENQLIANFNVRMGAAVSLFGYYTLSYANANAVQGEAGGTSFPMNQYDLAQSYGPAPWVTRNRFFVGGSFGLPMGFSFSPFLVASSGRPYNVTDGQDLNGDSIFNDRPYFVSTPCVSCVATDFTATPTTGALLVPPNYLTGPGQFSMNARISKTFGFGKEVEGGGGGGGGHYHDHHGGLGGRGLSSGGGGGGHFGAPSDRRYTLELGVMAHNIFNKVNYGTPEGNISSGNFGKSLSLAGGFFNNQSANRMLNLFLRFNF